MVAIQVPRESAEWPAAAPVVVPRGPDLGARSDGSSARVARPLPDRATRVRRRRLAVLVLAVTLVAVGTGAAQALRGLTEVDGSPAPRAVDVRPAPVAGHSYVVQPGDTLWSIAAEIAPDEDPRIVVDALRAANGGPELEVGQELTLDVG
jgi:nucleoid-associated protein YgaU